MHFFFPEESLLCTLESMYPEMHYPRLSFGDLLVEQIPFPLPRLSVCVGGGAGVVRGQHWMLSLRHCSPYF